MTRMPCIALCVFLMASGCKTPRDSSALRNADDLRPSAAALQLVGYVPSRYLAPAGGVGNRDNQATYTLAAVSIEGNAIRTIEPLTDDSVQERAGRDGVLILKQAGGDYDVIYPGMINLHNHTKQNMLPVWADAKGQFANRFEWRDEPLYKKAVSFNINPWVAAPIATCAAFRWSELQAMVLGTTHLQGPSSCISNFAIHQVEDPQAYPADSETARLDGVQAPTDLVVPEDMTFVWKGLKPLVDQGGTFEQALVAKLKEHCPRLVQAAPEVLEVNTAGAVKALSDKAQLASLCDGDPEQMQRYLANAHATIARRKMYLTSPRHAGIIIHLAEGRRSDPYNRIEFEMLKVFGLDAANVNLVHGVGIDRAGYAHMRSKGMGLIWSPFSNLLLYGETADIEAAIAAGVTVAIGSDWTPTGTRGVLEELKVARAYAEKFGLRHLVTDEFLYRAVTENPARMLNHFEATPGDGRHDLGTIATDAAASLVVMRRRVADPSTNLVTAESRDVQLVLVDGQAVYGERAYIEALAPQAQLETLPQVYAAIDQIASAAPPTDTTDPAQQQEELARLPQLVQMPGSTGCGFAKVYVVHDSGEPLIRSFAAATGLDLDRPSAVTKLLGVNLLTQGYNRRPNGGKGDAAFALKRVPPMFGCDDPGYDARLTSFVRQEVDDNRAKRLNVRQSLGRVPRKLADQYGLPYDAAVDY